MYADSAQPCQEVSSRIPTPTAYIPHFFPGSSRYRWNHSGQSTPTTTWSQMMLAKTSTATLAIRAYLDRARSSQ